jgi:hypothetical protein
MKMIKVQRQARPGNDEFHLVCWGRTTDFTRLFYQKSKNQQVLSRACVIRAKVNAAAIVSWIIGPKQFNSQTGNGVPGGLA